jgi:hypothetical protein
MTLFVGGVQLLEDVAEKPEEEWQEIDINGYVNQSRMAIVEEEVESRPRASTNPPSEIGDDSETHLKSNRGSIDEPRYVTSVTESSAAASGQTSPRGRSKSALTGKIDLDSILARAQGIELKVDAALEQTKGKKKKKNHSTDVGKGFTAMSLPGIESPDRTRSSSTPPTVARQNSLSQAELESMISSANQGHDTISHLLKTAPAADTKKLEKLVKRVEGNRRSVGLVPASESAPSPSIRSSVTGKDLPLRVLDENDVETDEIPEHNINGSVEDIIKRVEAREQDLKKKIERAKSPSARSGRRSRGNSKSFDQPSPVAAMEVAAEEPPPPVEDFVARPPRRSCCIMFCCGKKYAVFEEIEEPPQHNPQVAQASI